MNKTPKIKFGKLDSKNIIKIKNEVNKFNHLAEQSTTVGKKEPNLNIRNSVSYFPNINQSPFIYNFLTSLFIENYFDMSWDFSKLPEIQYLKYKTSGHYKWHKDTLSPIDGFARGMTFSLNITEEEKYNGGKLEIKTFDGTILTLEKSIGSYVFFPSCLRHKANEVLTGEREVIVSWFYLSFDEIKKICQKEK